MWELAAIAAILMYAAVEASVCDGTLAADANWTPEREFATIQRWLAGNRLPMEADHGADAHARRQWPAAHRSRTDPDRPLLDVLREDLGLTGAKYGCGERQCGACTVLANGRPIFSCSTRASATVKGRKIETIEGPRRRRCVASTAAGVRRSRRLPVRLLCARHGHDGGESAPAAIRIRRRKKSVARCSATSAAVVRTRGSPRQCRKPREARHEHAAKTKRADKHRTARDRLRRAAGAGALRLRDWSGANSCNCWGPGSS